MDAMFKKLSAAAVLFTLVFSISSSAAAGPEPAFYLSLDEGKGENAVDSAGRLSGEIKGAVWAEGRFGSGLFFDGKQREAAHAEFREGIEGFRDFEGGPFTISAWIKPDSTQAHNRQQDIVNMGFGIGPGWRLYFSWHMIYFRSGTGQRDEEGKADSWALTTNPVTDKVMLDEWNHVAVVRDGEGIVSIYLNGRKAAESEGEFRIVPSTAHPLTIGSMRRGGAYGFKGVIDEVKLYRGALAGGDILEEYRAADAGSIILDGRLEDDIWKKGRRFSGFNLIASDELAPVQTEVIFNYDDENLYFAFICEEPETGFLKNEVRENTTRVYRDDSVEIMLDSDNVKEDYYHFIFNPAGYYGARFRTQSGHVGFDIQELKLYTGGRIEDGRWILQAAIPYSSLGFEEGPKEEISLNFARNRRVNLAAAQESTTGEKGQFHNPFVFMPVKLQNVDLSLYALRVASPEVKEAFMKEGGIETKLVTGIKNPTPGDKELAVTLYEAGLGVLSMLNLHIPANGEQELDFDFIVPEAGEYRIGLNIREKGVEVYEAVFPIEISHSPIALDLLKPRYRNSIYSKQKIDEIQAKVDVVLKEEEMRGARGEVVILDAGGRELARSRFSPAEENIISMKKPALREGEYRVSARLTKSGGEVLEISVPLYKLAPAEGSEVYIDENLNMVLNGRPIMPIIWWGGSPVEEIAKTGADAIIVGVGSLDELHEAGMLGHVMLFWGRQQREFYGGRETLTDEAVLAITERVNSVKDHPAVLSYYLVDEPENKNYSPRVLKEAYELIKSIDPYHPISARSSRRAVYFECTDMFLPSTYLNPLDDGSMTRPMTSIPPRFLAAQEAGRGKKFIGVTSQMFDYGRVYAARPPHSTRNNRAPTFVESRCMNYLSILYGARGFEYYVYGRRDPEHWGAVNYPDLRVGAPYLISEKKSLEQAIMLGEDRSGDVISDNENLHFMAKNYRGSRYIIAVNVLPEAFGAEIKVPRGITRLKVISENRQVAVSGGKFTDGFAPYQVHIYTDNLQFRDAIDLAKVEEEIKKEGGWFAYQYRN